MVDIANIALLPTVYPVDKIVYAAEGSFSVGGSSSSTTTLTHNLNRQCLPELSWSIDNVTYWDAGVRFDVDGSLSTPDFVDVTAGCDTNTVTLYASNMTGSSQTIYYKLFLLWPQ